MVKRIFSCVFICILIILLLTACTEANGDSGNQSNGGTSVGYEEENGIKYYLKEDDTYLAVVESESAITSFYIPEARRGKAITEISLEKNVTALPDNALENGNNIKKITIGTDVTSISKGALKSCTSLEHVTVPFLDTHFGYMFGVSTYNYNNKYIPSSLKSVTVIGGDLIPAYAFSGCESISSISIPDSITDIGERAFEGCTALTYNEYDNAYYLGNSGNPYKALIKAKNTSISSCRVHSDTHVIASYAFESCYNLTSVTLGKAIINIGNAAFNNCPKLVEIINHSELDITTDLTNSWHITYYYGLSIHSGDSIIVNKDDYLFFTHASSNYLLGYVGDNTELILPNDYNGESYGIYKYAFANYSTISDITIPENVTEFGEAAFSGCSSIRSITVPFVGKIEDSSTCKYPFGYLFGKLDYEGGVATEQDHYYTTDIDTPAPTVTYYIPSSLTDVTITGGVIYGSAFQNCSGIKNVTLTDNVTEIVTGAFSGCSSIESITVPFIGKHQSSAYPLGYIFGESSYEGGIATKQHYYTTDKERVNTYCIPLSLKSVNVTGSNIPYGAFYNCSGITDINITCDITTINDYTFYGCSGLTSFSIPSSVSSIGSYTFSQCYNLASITIPSNVTSIGYFAFSECNSLTNVTIPESITNILWGTFSGCSNLTEVYYVGGANKWNRIDIGSDNTDLTDARIYYYLATEPTESGNYWYYDDSGKIAVW